MTFYFFLWLLLGINLVEAASIARQRPLSHLTPVESVSIDTESGVLLPNKEFTLTISIPSDRHYHNINRRWWAISDPNNKNKLKNKRGATNRQLGERTPDWFEKNFDVSSPFLRSEFLYSYLTANSSQSLVEVPQNHVEFKLTLEPNYQVSDAHVLTADSAGNLVPHPDFASSPGQGGIPYRGTAYRRMAFYSDGGQLKSQYKPVGWARVVVVKDGPNPIVHGIWKVDDSEGLGVAPAIYHVECVDSFKRTLRPDELYLLDNVSTPMILWRDIDMRLIQDNTFEYDDDIYDFLDSSYDYRLKDSYKLDSTFQKYMEKTHFTKRSTVTLGSGSDSDTGSSGFSSGTNLRQTIGDTQGCPSPKKIALIGIAADCNFMSDFNSTSDVRSHIISIVNTASQQYEASFNVSLGLSAIVMPNDTACPSTANSSALPWNYECKQLNDSIGDRLSLLSQWRGRESEDGLATWSLLTSCSQGSVVGLSWLGMLCSSTPYEEGNDTFVSGTNVISHTSLDWRVLAHEIGHSFGAVHDCTADTCAQNLEASSGCCPLSQSTCNANGKYIMNPVSSESQDSFSSCTQGNVCSAMGRNSVNSTCLTSNTRIKLVTANECGNGIVEEGEDCDCGGVDGCGDNPCCDPTTCKFTSGSVCDDSNDICCSSCQFASSQTVCRASQGPCDSTEYCTGNSTGCPADHIAPNGQKCSLNASSDDSLTCISGHCTSRDLQCVTLLANTTYTADGTTLNITRACDDDSSCQLSCVDPSFGDTCFTTYQNFLDGTPCRGTGTCQHGICIGGSNGNFIHSPFGAGWLSQNRNVVIGIAVGFGVLLLAAIVYSYIRRRLRAREAMSKISNQPFQQPGPANFYGYDGYMTSGPPPGYYEMGPIQNRQGNEYLY